MPRLRDGQRRDPRRGRPASSPSTDGRWLHFSAPDRRRLRAVADRHRRRPGRAADQGRHYISGWDAVRTGRGGVRIAYLRSTPTETPDLWMLEAGGRSKAKPTAALTSFNADVLDELELRTPIERHVTVDGRDIQGWFLPAGDGRRGRWSSRSTAARTRSTAGRSSGSSRSSPRPASASSTATRAAPRATARHSTTPTTATGDPARRATCSPASTPSSPTGWPTRSGWRHRRLVRRLPDELDRRPRRPVPGRDDLPVGQRHGRAVHDRRHLAAATGRGSSSRRRRGRTRTTSARSRR